MNLDKVIIPSNIEINYIQKKYFDKYIYKVLFTVDKSKLVKENILRWRGINTYHYTNRFQLLNELITEVKSNIVDDDYRLRAESISLSFFTNSEDNIAKLIVEMPQKLMAIYRPLNAAHIDMIENHKKVLVRASLFEKKYKFKVYLKPSWEQREKRFKEFKDWLLESNLDYEVNAAMRQYFYTNKSMRGIGYTAAVYFNDPQDLMMFQLRFNDKILKIEEAVLLSDL